MSDASLSLGTLFEATGVTDFLAEVGKVKVALQGLYKDIAKLEQAQAKAAASKSKGMTLYDELTATQKAMGSATGQMPKYQKALAGLIKIHGDWDSTLKVLRSSLDKAEAAIQRQAMAIRRNGNFSAEAMRKAQNYLATTDRMGIVNQKARGLITYTADGIKQVGIQSATTTKQLHQYAAATKKVTTAKVAMGKQISRVEGGLERLKAALKVTVAYGTAATMIFAFTRALRDGGREIVNFDQALKNLQAISGATSAEVATMDTTMREVANVTKFSTTEIADGMVLLTQAGFSAAEATNAIKAVSELATGTMSDFATTTDLLSTTMRAYNLQSVEAGRVSDVMANAINKSKLTIDKLRIAFNYVAPVAAQTGLSLEETAASMMALADRGQRASTIGTGLRQVLSRLIAPTGKLKEAFEDHNIKLAEVNPRLVGYQTAMKNLLPALVDAKTGAIDTTKAFELFGLRGAGAAAVLAQAFASGEFQDALNEVYEVGSSAAMAATQVEGLANKIKNLSDKMGLLFLAIGDAGVTNVFKDLVGAMQSFVGWITKIVSTPLGGLAAAFTLLTAAISGTTLALRYLITTFALKYIQLMYVNVGLLTMKIQTLAKSVGYLNATFAMLSRSPVLVWVSIGAAVAAAVLAISKLNRRVSESVAIAQRQAVEFERVSSSLGVYIGGLKNLKEKMDDGKATGVEYEALLTRLKEAHPELSKVVDVNTASYEELVNAMRALNRQGLEKTLQAQIEALRRFRLEIIELKAAAAIDPAGSKDGIISADPVAAGFKNYIDDFLKKSEEGKVLGKELDGMIRQLTSSLTGQVRMQNMTAEEAQVMADAYLEASGVAEDLANKIRTALSTALDKLAKQMAGLAKGDEVEKAGKRTNRLLELEKQYHALVIQMTEDETKKIKEEYAKRQAAIDKWYNQRKALADNAGEKTGGITSQYENLSALNKGKRDYDLLELERKHQGQLRKLRDTEREIELEKQKQSAAGQVEIFKKLEAEINALKVDSARETVEAYEQSYNDAVAIFGKESQQAIKAKQEWADASLSLQQTVTKADIDAAQERLDAHIKELEKRLAAVEQYSAEYMRIMRELNAAGKKTDEEVTQAAVIASNDSMAILKLVAEEYRNSIGTMGKVTYDMLSDLFGKLHGNLKDLFGGVMRGEFDSFLDFVRGVSDSFIDIWADAMAKIVMKWIAAKVAMGIAGSIAGGFGAGFSTAGSDTSSSRVLFSGRHKGGVVGKDPPSFRRWLPASLFQHAPRLHSGLRSDEFPAILQRGETVIPKGGGAGGVTMVNQITVQGGGSKAEDRSTGETIAKAIEIKVRQILRDERRYGGINFQTRTSF
jgi:TP901 family phage tail tape measure protein